MAQSVSTDTTRAILQAYGYTPRTLAIDLEVSQKVARRILYGKNELWLGDYLLLKKGILGVDMNFLFGHFKPGEMKAERERMEAAEAEKQRKEEARRAEWEAEQQADRERLQGMTPQERCREVAELFIGLIEAAKQRDYTAADVAREIIKIAEERGEAA